MALVASLPIDSLTIGFPCVSKDIYRMALESAKEVARCHYSFNVGMTGRTVLSDIDPIIDIVNKRV